jgi:hypothetical protein
VQEEEVDMGEFRRWSVEAKEFEISIKGGLMGMRIVEKRNNRQRSVWVHRDELSWLVGAVEKAANVDTSEVFWDQSRAGYIRLITQKRENRHGRFLTIEEFNGSRRCGSVLVPEGWSGRGWSKMIEELRGACSMLKIGRGLRSEKPKLITNGNRSYAEVVGDTKRMEEKGTLTPEKPVGVAQTVPECEVGRREKPALSIKLMSVPTSSSLGTVGYDQQKQKPYGTTQEGGEAGPAHRSSVCSTVKKGEEPCKPRGSRGEVECQGAQGKVKGRLESSFNAKQELGGFREWLWQLRSEVDAGLGRIDVIIKRLEVDGLGQWKKKNKKVWISKPRPKRKPKFKEKTSGVSGPRINSDGAEPSMGHKVVVLEPNPVMAKPCVGQASLDGLFQKPTPQDQMGVDKSMELGPNKSLDLGAAVSTDGPNLASGLVMIDGPTDEEIPIAGSDAFVTAVPESHLAALMNGSSERTQRELVSAQRSPMGSSGNSETQGKVPAVPVSGSGAVHGVRGSVCRPESSWVAGRTGFGPVHTGEVVGSSVLVVDSGKKVTTSARRISVQIDEETTVDNGNEAILGGEEMEAQACPLEKTDVLEVYSRRKAPTQGIPKMQHRVSEVSTVGDAADTLLQDGTYDEGVDQLNAEKSIVECTLEKSMEVSDIAGLSWDGQERWKEERFRCIIVDRTEKGCGGDTGIPDFQQAVESMGRFWGNCSDDEA